MCGRSTIPRFGFATKLISAPARVLASIATILNWTAIRWPSSAQRTCRAKCSGCISSIPMFTCGIKIFAQIHDAGLNMIRTGWWTGWDKFCDENGQPYERTLRTIEAYLMTARKYGLPVQFNFFAFLPEVLGGTNAFP